MSSEQDLDKGNVGVCLGLLALELWWFRGVKKVTVLLETFPVLIPWTYEVLDAIMTGCLHIRGMRISYATCSICVFPALYQGFIRNIGGLPQLQQIAHSDSQWMYYLVLFCVNLVYISILGHLKSSLNLWVR